MRNRKHFDIFAGYFGGGNIGDELILKMGLSYADPSKTVCVISSDPWFTKDKYNVRSIHKYNIFALIYYMFYANRLIFPGGGIFQDMTSSRSLYYYLVIVLLAKLFGVRVEMYGMGLGPFVNYLNRILTVNILKRVDHLQVRDEKSMKFLKGMRKNRAYLGPDTLMKFSNSFLMNNPGSSADTFTIGINLRPWHNVKRLIKEIVLVLSELKSDRKVAFFLIPFSHADEKVLRRLLPYLNTNTYMIDINPENAFDLISTCDLTIGMRLHFNMIAQLLEKPSINIAYDRKCRDVLHAGDSHFILNMSRITRRNFANHFENALKISGYPRSAG